jgi:hypothetical protein
MPLASVGETTVLNSLLVGRFLSLHTAPPPLGEASGGAYARQSVTFAKTTGPDPTVYSNTALVQFPAATANWGTITHFGVWTALSGGNLLAYNIVSVVKPVYIDDIVRWEVGALVVSTD